MGHTAPTLIDRVVARWTGRGRRELIARLEDGFESDFLSADEVLAADPHKKRLGHKAYGKLKADFVQSWSVRKLQQPLDLEQAAVVASTTGDVQVFARAGSGKTKTLVARAIFLQKHCRVSPGEILLLAFNTKAAEEMKNRLAETLGESLPHVMTFHALAYALVHPEENLIFDNEDANQPLLSREIQKVIDEHVKSGKYKERIRDLMLAHFREDWKDIVNGRSRMNMKDSLAHYRALPRESLKGDYVKSYGEKVIADALFEHGIEYKYERNFRWNGTNYRPDFTISTGRGGGVIVEYFGLEGDSDYDQMSQDKRNFWAGRDGWTFVELSPKGLARYGKDWFTQSLLDKLEEAGVSHRRRSEEEIWELIEKRAVGRFAMAMRNFVSRCRKRDITPEDFKLIVAGHTPYSTAEAQFLDVGVSIYQGYLQRLAENRQEDFDGLMWRAASQVRAGQTHFVRDKGRERGDIARLKFIMIDEFQDFSHMFRELVDAVRSVNPGMQFFCVGDDWQAINGFAGSDLQFFDDFTAYFEDTSLRHIRTNYRSSRSVVDVGNAVMSGRGPAARPIRSDAGSALLCKLEDFRPSVSEQAVHDDDWRTPALLRLIKYFLDRGMDVVMLSRRNAAPWYVSYGEPASRTPDRLARFLEHIRAHLPEEDRGRVEISTTHKYKGLEHPAVVVLDAVQQSYPLIHSNWVFLRAFGDSIPKIEDEERRLFYVAVTRAEHSLAILTETPSQSPYLSDLQRRVRLTELSWEDLSPAPPLGGGRLEIRASNAYKVRGKLKALSYQWNHQEEYWCKFVPEEGFSFDTLLGQPWAQSDVRLEVYSETGELLHHKTVSKEPFPAD